MSRAILMVALAGLAWGAWAQCENDSATGARLLQAQEVSLCWSARPDQPAVGQHFQLDVRVWTETGPWTGELKIDAIMPAHGHGMNYLPVVSRPEPGHYLADGLLLHMPGEWELVFRLDGDGRRIKLSSLLDAR